jgi:hypothetical protein
MQDDGVAYEVGGTHDKNSQCDGSTTQSFQRIHDIDNVIMCVGFLVLNNRISINPPISPPVTRIPDTGSLQGKVSMKANSQNDRIVMQVSFSHPRMIRTYF